MRCIRDATWRVPPFCEAMLSFLDVSSLNLGRASCAAFFFGIIWPSFAATMRASAVVQRIDGRLSSVIWEQGVYGLD